jgi:hypothetical protein
MKRLKWIIPLVILAFLAVAIGVHVWWLNSGAPQERHSLIWPFGGAGAAATRALKSRQLLGETAPELAAQGVTCTVSGMGEEEDAEVIYLTEKAWATVTLTAGPKAIGSSSLAYTLYDRTGQNLGEGKLDLDSPLAARQSRAVTIADVRLKQASRIVFSRRSVNN